MDSHGDDEDKDCFYDAPEHDFGFHLWTKDPDSVSNRRRMFLQSMGFSFNKTESSHDELPNGSSCDSVKESLKNETTSSPEDTDDQSLFFSRNVSSSSGSSSTSFPQGLSESSSSRSDSLGDSPSDDSVKKSSQSWLRKKLGVLTHVLESLDSAGLKRRIARVQTNKKHFKELSSLCVDQEFSAHDGSILAIKFSPDGKFIASAGEDCVVRVWSITEEERTEQYEVDSGVYFGLNQHSQLEPLYINNNNEKTQKKTTSSFLKKSSESTCVVLPSTIFSISEKPLHEFRGHTGEILDLSWSGKGYLLLSSSVDESVRLWRLDCDECLETFSHNNFVTCVAFNPVDDNYFITGSIDGKVRIWDVSRCRVVDYTDIRDIVTALCFRPDAKGVVIGSMTGICRFYHLLDNQLQMDREVNLSHGKKKVASKRISGLEYFPNDSDKVMVTCADSQIRIICGEDVICKLKASGLCTTSASFTLDGKHIVSTTDDSGIHVWNNNSQLPSKKPSSGKPKKIRSCESFTSQNASVAIPWLRQANRNSLNKCVAELEKKIWKMDSCFSPMKGSTMWPEEELEEAATTMSSRGKNLKLLKNVLQPNMWGLVIVTATWDGRIRVFNNYGLPNRV